MKQQEEEREDSMPEWRPGPKPALRRMQPVPPGFMEALSQAAFCADTSGRAGPLGCIHLHGGYAWASDLNCAAVRVRVGEPARVGGPGAIVSVRHLRRLLRKHKQPTRYLLTASRLWLAWAEKQEAVPLHEPPFPDLRQVFRRARELAGKAATVEYDPPALAQAVAAAREARDRIIRVQLKGDRLIFTCEGKAAEARVARAPKRTPSKVTFTTDGRLLHEAVQRFPRLAICGEGMLLFTAEDGRTEHLLMEQVEMEQVETGPKQEGKERTNVGKPVAVEQHDASPRPSQPAPAAVKEAPKSRRPVAPIRRRLRQLKRRLDRSLVDTIEVSIRVGRELSRLKEALPWGAYLRAAKADTGWKEDQLRNYVAIWEKSEAIRKMARAHRDWNQWVILEFLRRVDRGEQLLHEARSCTNPVVVEAVEKGELTAEHLLLSKAISTQANWSGWLEVAAAVQRHKLPPALLREYHRKMKWIPKDRRVRALTAFIRGGGDGSDGGEDLTAFLIKQVQVPETCPTCGRPWPVPEHILARQHAAMGEEGEAAA